MNKDLKVIHVNIWDDFYDDGFVTEGKIQKSRIYVEEQDSDISEDEKEEILVLLYSYIKQNIPMEGVEFSMNGDIQIKHMTHKQLDNMMEILDNTKFSYAGIPLSIYSES